MKLLFLFPFALWFVASFAHADVSRDYHDAIERAVADKAARDTQWLRLGHYKARGAIRKIFRSEFLSEADGAAFFISPTGKSDPASELRATLEAFAQPVRMIDGKFDETTHAQCMYPARRKWSFHRLGWEKVLRDNGFPVLACEHRTAWKNQLDAEGVSLVFASAYLNNAASMFGHTFLKFHSKANKHGRDLLDYGVNFAAETGGDGGVPYALFGLLGIYPGRFSMQPFHQTLRTYSNLEGRDLIEYRLRFTPEELDFFIDHLFELERTHFDYYFLTENCSYFLLAALETAKPEISLSDEFWYEVIPADSVRVAARTENLIASTKFRPSLLTMFRAQADRLSSDDVRFARDVIDRGVTSGWETASTAALDLALDYGAVRATGDSSFDSINHQIRSERAKRGGTSHAVTIETPKRPEEGHDPARIGAIYQQGREKGARGEMGLQFRFAYHDRLSNDDGYLRGTTLEVLRMTATTDHQDPARIHFREVTVLDILSTQPLDAFSKPLSWRAAFGVREPSHTRSLGPFLNGGAGSTFEFSKYLWITGLIDAEILSNPDLENAAALFLGPRLIATAFLHDKLKLGTDYSLMRAITRERHVDQLAIELAYAPTRNFEIRAGFSRQYPEMRSEWSVKVYQHLLL